MIYLDNGATSLWKPPGVSRRMEIALKTCGNPGRSGHAPALQGAKTVFAVRELAAELFECSPEQVVFTSNCTHGINIALRSLVKPGGRVVLSGFEHNAVTRTLEELGAKQTVAGRKLFDWEDMLRCWDGALAEGADAAVFTHVSNVFGYILPVEELADMCRKRGVPFLIDAAQSAGCIPISMSRLGADFIAMPGHKGLLGPQGTGILLCGGKSVPLLFGGTGSESRNQKMPEELPERLEAGTLNVPGIAGLGAGLGYIRKFGPEKIGKREHAQLIYCAGQLEKMGFRVFYGPHQAGTVSFVPKTDCEDFAGELAKMGIATRAGLHCAPLAHESAGTLESGTVRVSFGADASREQADVFLRACRRI